MQLARRPRMYQSLYQMSVFALTEILIKSGTASLLLRLSSLTRQAVGCGRAGCQGDANINIRLLRSATTRAPALVGAVETIGVATTTAVCKHSTSASVAVVIPANEAAATRPNWHWQGTSTCSQHSDHTHVHIPTKSQLSVMVLSSSP